MDLKSVPKHDVATDLESLAAIERKILWLATAMVDAANSSARKDPDGVKVAACNSWITG